MAQRAKNDQIFKIAKTGKVAIKEELTKGAKMVKMAKLPKGP